MFSPSSSYSNVEYLKPIRKQNLNFTWGRFHYKDCRNITENTM